MEKLKGGKRMNLEMFEKEVKYGWLKKDITYNEWVEYKKLESIHCQFQEVLNGNINKAEIKQMLVFTEDIRAKFLLRR
jgi:hypothetical protein